MGRIIKGDYYGSVTVGQRGQIVLPADVRRDFGIEPGDKILVYGRISHGKIELLTAELMDKLVTLATKEVVSLEGFIKGLKKKKA